MQADESAILAAADACIDAFGRHDRAAYFATFAPDATFIFHTTPGVLRSRAAWEQEWDRLVAEDGLPYRSASWHLWRDHRVFAPYATVQNWVEDAGGKNPLRPLDRLPRRGSG